MRKITDPVELAKILYETRISEEDYKIFYDEEKPEFHEDHHDEYVYQAKRIMEIGSFAVKK